MLSLPPLSKFDGGTSADGDKETVKEWLEQFEMVAGICRWDNPTRLANLVTRLRGKFLQVIYASKAQQL